MRVDFTKCGSEEMRDVRKQSRAHFWVIGVFSLFANLLVLTGPIYMLQVYDRVLSSGSVETLLALSGLVLFLYVIMGVLDFTRARIMTRIGLQFYLRMERRVFDASLRKASVLPDVRTRGMLGDLDAVRRLFAAPVVIAAYDLPWTPVFFAAIFLFHPLLGIAAVIGAGALMAITIANQLLSKRNQRQGAVLGRVSNDIAQQLHDEAGFVRTSGMHNAGYARWQLRRGPALAHECAAAGIGGGFSTLTKTLRLFLQSAILGLAAWLVIGGQMTAGGMIAGSVLLGRALAPIEALLNQWPNVQQGRQSWDRVATLLGEVPPDAPRTELPKPRAMLSVKGLTVVPPGERQATLKSITFAIEPGQALGVIGPSGSGKSSLARALIGLWPPTGGHIRLDGATLDQYDPEVLGKYNGYLPQRVALFDGTIAQNIARLEETPDDVKLVAAAKLAGAHEMILALPQGYDTPVDAGNLRLSGGQLQRIGLARALYDDPVVVILDEPNANLDNDGSEALNTAIATLKARGRAVLIMAHRPAAIKECDMLLVLDSGMRMAFGPKDQVLAGMVKNAGAIQSKVPAMAGVR